LRSGQRRIRPRETLLEKTIYTTLDMSSNSELTNKYIPIYLSDFGFALFKSRMYINFNISTLWCEVNMRKMIYTLILVGIVLIISASIFSATINVPADSVTIQAGINGAVDGDTVLVADGTYTGDGNRDIKFKGKNIVLKSINGPEATIINCEGSEGGSENWHRGISINNGETEDAVVDGFTIMNGYDQLGAGIVIKGSSPTIKNNIIENNYAFDYTLGRGGGILIGNGNPIIKDNIIRNNVAYENGGGIYCDDTEAEIFSNIIIYNQTVQNMGMVAGAGIYCASSDLYIANNIIANNSALGTGNSGSGGGLAIISVNEVPSTVTIINNTIFGNSSNEKGGGIYLGNGTYSTITYNIFWGNTATVSGHQIYVSPYLSVQPEITYCDIEGGWSSGDNINADPMFCDSENDNFHLNSSSACLAENNDYEVFIGALGEGCTQTDISHNGEPIPYEFSLRQNYPNPFNPRTEISFSLPRMSFVNLSVYNLLGQKVETLINKEMEAGQYSVTWDGSNVGSGIYFYRLESGDFIETKKMLLLK